MTDLAASLHAWLSTLSSVNGVEWCRHLISREFSCGCQPFTTYCPEWTAVITPPTPAGPKAEAHSFWVHTEPDPISDATLQLEIPRRKYVVLNGRDHTLIPRIKVLNPDCTVFCYKDISSVRSYDTHPDARMLPAGVSYGYAKTMSAWQARSAGGVWLQYDGYPGHWQMDVGQQGYQNAWATNVSKMKALGFDGIWMDNALWFRDTYHEGTPVRGYATNEAFRYAYLSFFLTVCPRLKAAGLLTVANMSNARLVTNGWQNYLEAGLDGGFDEWWLVFNDDDLLSEYPEGWRRQVAQIAYAEQKGKFALVQPHFTAGNEEAFRFALASYFMAYPGGSGKSAIAELQVTDGYDDPSPWHPEYDWNLGTPLGGYQATSSTPNVFFRKFTQGAVVVNANKTGSPAVTVHLDGPYLNEGGASVTSVSLPGTSGTILRKVL